MATPELDKVPGDLALYIGGSSQANQFCLLQGLLVAKTDIPSIFTLRRKEALASARITHVVSALNLPLDKALFETYTQLVIGVDDVDDEDILQHFPESNAFIEQGLKEGGGVLVHCAMGKSRSATLVLAYLIHQSPWTTTASSALSLLRQSRPICEPNPGFMAQLELYHSMGAPDDVMEQPAYQRWLYKREVEQSLACGQAPERIRFEDEVQASTEESTGEARTELRCRKCRRQLATSAYLVPHAPRAETDPLEDSMNARAFGPIGSMEQIPPSRGSRQQQQPAQQQQQRCAHFFLEPLSWMRPELEQGRLDGRLECPNERCRANVGKYAWQGMKCSCGAWIVPGISIARSKVDEARVKRRGPPGVGGGGKI